MRLSERGGELARLSEGLADCVAGRGGLALVAGGPASGKTALVSAFADEVRGHDVALLSATAAPTERTLRLGVVSQLARGARGLSAAVDAAARADDGPLTPRVVDDLGEVLLRLADERPVVVVVDDVQHVDDESLQVLLHLRGRARSVRVLIVLTEWERPSLARPPLHAALVRQPDHRVALGPLSQVGVADLLSAGLDEAAADRLAPACAELGGGNPYLTAALVDDQRGRRPYLVTDAEMAPVVGPAFREAVLDCAGRWEPEFLDAAVGLAVLGSADRLADLLELPPASVAQALDVLTGAGLVRDGGLRHPEIAATLLGSLAPDDAARLHARAAELLYGRGADVTEVARHLVAAGPVPRPWAVAPLRLAAEQSAVDDVEFAVRCLELAMSACEDEGCRAELRAALVRVAWRVNPAASARHLSALSGSLDAGGLDWRDAVPVIRHLLWQGDLAGAGARMRATRESAGAPDVRTAAELRLAAEWIHGRLRDGDPDGVRAALATSDRADSSANSWQRTATLLESWTRGSAKETLRAAEHVLQSCLGDVPPEVGALAILALEHADRQDRVRYWCETLGEQATRQGAVTWQAVLAAVRGDVAWRRGDLAAASAAATEALELLAPQSWGVLIGLPLSTLVLVNSAMGRHEEAAELLARPVPEAMFATAFGIRYLHASGQHSLATGHTLAALDAFEDCAAWMRGRDSAVPPVVPWRSALAEAYLVLGRRKDARDLVTEQLNRASGGGVRMRAISLRVLAACGDSSQRVPVLRDAIQFLERCGDRLELARALADLSQAHRELGQLSSARLVLRKADQVTKACDVDGVTEQLRDSLKRDVRRQQVARGPEGETVPRAKRGADVDVDSVTALSDAERKVAELAADGHTNREIGRKLYITVSTVEQHLTRVYRKLSVSKRTDLPSALTGAATLTLPGAELRLAASSR